MTDTCGLMSCEPFATWDRDSQSWKTSEATSLWALTLSSLTLPQWGGLHDGELCEHPTPELHTSAPDFSSLPTPTRADYRSVNPNPGVRNQGSGIMPASEHSLPAKIAALLPTPAVNDMGEGKTLEWWDDWAPRQKAADGRPAPHGRSLAIEAQRMLPTPRAQDEYERRNMKTMERIRDEGGDMTLPTWAKVVAPLLPTPTAQAAKHGETPDTTANGYGSNLWDLPSLLPTPTSRDHKGANQRGDATCLHGAITAQPSPDGSASSNDQPHHQLSLDGLALPA